MTITIPLRPSITSLVITITSLVVELACLSALFTFNAFCECRTLKNGRKVSVSRHRLRIQLLTIMATLSFVALEVITSANSQTSFHAKTTVAPCIRSVTRQGFDSDAIFFENQTITRGRDMIGISCIQVHRGEVHVQNGNYSLDNLDVQCDAETIFSYKPAELELLSPSSPGVIVHCDEVLEGCAAVLLPEENRLLVSQAFSTTWNFSEEIEFYPTQLHMSFGQDRLKSIPIQLLALFSIGVSDEGDVRRRILMDGVSSECLFDTDTREFTEIKFWAFVLTVVIWTVCIVFFVAMVCLRRSVFYDMSNALHWAKKTERPPLEVGGALMSEGKAFVRLAEKADGTAQVTIVSEQGVNESLHGPQNHNLSV